jgi:serine/threonine protein kinase
MSPEDVRFATNAESGAVYCMASLINQGAYGEAWLCLAPDRSWCVAKRIADSDSDLRKAWWNEIFKQHMYSPGQPHAHKNVVAVEGAFQDDDGEYWIIQELCLGSVEDLFAQIAEWRAAAVPALAMHLLDALSAVHIDGRAHGDVHPGNVLYTREPGDLWGMRFKLTDFGLAAQWWRSGLTEKEQDKSIVERDVVQAAQTLLQFERGAWFMELPESAADHARWQGYKWGPAVVAAMNGAFRRYRDIGAYELAKAIGVSDYDGNIPKA